MHYLFSDPEQTYTALLAVLTILATAFCAAIASTIKHPTKQAGREPAMPARSVSTAPENRAGTEQQGGNDAA